jgi:hypothetical protein
MKIVNFILLFCTLPIMAQSTVPVTVQVLVDGSPGGPAYTVDIPVPVPAPLPAPVPVIAPIQPTLIEYNNLEESTVNPGIWKLCYGTCSGSWGLPGSSHISYLPAFPPLSGPVLKLESDGSKWNSLAYRDLYCPNGGCQQVRGLHVAVDVLIPDATFFQGIELDPDFWTGANKLMASVQCDSVTGLFRFWNSATGHWVVTDAAGGTIKTYPCTILNTPGVVHSIDLDVTYDPVNNAYSYQTLIVDNATSFRDLNLTFKGSLDTSPARIGVQMQIDNKDSKGLPVHNVVYYSNYTLTER